ncbi:MAG: hypothetical protein Q4A79_02595 [Candidatus Saccharibacteria bacterium]|nr:hypothetical protein [Candidatus Saccharibacteria bacterium]
MPNQNQTPQPKISNQKKNSASASNSGSNSNSNSGQNSSSNPGWAMEAILEKIIDANNILVALSSDPSVDDIATVIGLTLCLDQAGKRTTAIYSGATPNALKFLKPEETFEASTDSLQDFVIALNKEKADHLRYKLDGDYVKIFITPYRGRVSEEDLEFSYGDFNVDLVIAINVSNGIDLDAALREHGRVMHDATVVNITTGNPGKFGEIEWSDKDASSIAEMVARLLYSTDGRIKVDKDEATAFLTGIVAATEHFTKPNTTAEALKIAAKLMSSGADQQLVSKNITFDFNSSIPPSPSDPNLNAGDDAKSAEADNDDEISVSSDGSISISHDRKPIESSSDDLAEPSSTEKPDATTSTKLSNTDKPDDTISLEPSGSNIASAELSSADNSNNSNNSDSASTSHSEETLDSLTMGSGELTEPLSAMPNLDGLELQDQGDEPKAKNNNLASENNNEAPNEAIEKSNPTEQNQTIDDDLKAAAATLATAGAETTPEVVQEPLRISSEEAPLEAPNLDQNQSLDFSQPSDSSQPTLSHSMTPLSSPLNFQEDDKYSKMLEEALSASGTPPAATPAPITSETYDSPLAAVVPPVATKPEINGVPEINYAPLPEDAVLPPPPVPPIDFNSPMPNFNLGPSSNLNPEPSPNIPTEFPTFDPSILSSPQPDSTSSAEPAKSEPQTPLGPQPSMQDQVYVPQATNPGAFKIPGVN